MTSRLYQGRHGRGWRLAIALAAFGALVSGCAETELALHAAKQMGDGSPAPAGGYKVGRPYKVNGVWYYPAENFHYSETGIASWYGPDFHGRRTANGERYNMNALTAAHRTLPLPSIVRVTNLRNGRAIKVRVNDRGPFARGRIIDLSRRSAQLLGFIDQGTAPVRVEIVADESRQLAAGLGNPLPVSSAPAPVAKLTPVSLTRQSAPDVNEIQPVARRTTPAPASFPISTAAAATPTEPLLFVQAGAFIDRERADRLRQRLSGIGGAMVVGATVGEKRFYRVRIGPLATVADGDRMLDRVIAAGFPQARLVVD